MAQRVHLTLQNNLADLERLTAQVQALLEGWALAPAALFAANLALEEMLTNVIKYGYDDAGAHTIGVDLVLETGVLLLRLEDDGHAFDPLAAPAPDTGKPLDERPIGGLGIHLVRSRVPDMRYQRQDGKNVLELRIPAEAPAIRVIEPQGKLDAFGVKQFQERLKADLSVEVLCVVLDLHAVSYVSSAGLRAFMMLYTDLAARGGALALCGVNSYCREVLEQSGYLAHLPVFAGREEATAFCARRVRERESREHWSDLEVLHTSHGTFRVLPGDTASGVVTVSGSLKDVLQARLGENDLRSRPVGEFEYSLGVGALGESASAAAEVLGYTVTLGRSLVWLPTDGHDTPDFLVAGPQGSRLALHAAFDISLEGGFHEYLSFESAERPGTTLGDLYRDLFVLAAKRRPDFRGALGLAGWAEMATVHGQALKRAPLARHAPANGKLISHADNVGEWLAVDREPRHRDVTCLFCGAGVDLSRSLEAYDEEAFNACFYLQPANIGGRQALLLNHGAVFARLPQPEPVAALDKVVQAVLSKGEFLDMRALCEESRVTRALLGVSYIQTFRRAAAASASTGVETVPLPPPTLAAAPGTREPAKPGAVAPARYRLDKLLGRGGMGEVYQGYDLLLQRPVAIKKLLTAEGEGPARFTLEAQTAARLFKHPGVVTVLDMVAVPFAAIIMELVEGVSLRELIALRALTAEQSRLILDQAADVLAYAHGMQVVHRDIKPDNVLVELDPLRVKIADFGIARFQAGPRQTVSEHWAGTLPYMSREQVYLEPVDHRTDIFSWGVMAYEMFSGGRLPFGERGVLQPGGYMTPEPLEQVCVFKVPAPALHTLSVLVMQCIREQARDRPSDFGRVRQELQKVSLAGVP